MIIDLAILSSRGTMLGIAYEHGQASFQSQELKPYHKVSIGLIFVTLNITVFGNN